MSKIKSFFSDFRVSAFLLLGTATCCCFLLFSFRCEILGIGQILSLDTNRPYGVDFEFKPYFFLNWNLFLAWIPFLMAMGVALLPKKKWSIWFAIPLICCWLLFLPNAPYIITDFVHLRKNIHLPYWYDLCMIFSYASTGLLLGLFSMVLIERYLADIIGEIWSKTFILCSIPLVGLGIWIGRYQRWNSWDIFTRPDAVLLDTLEHISHPIIHGHALGVIPVFTVIMFISYWMVQSLTPKNRIS